MFPCIYQRILNYLSILFFSFVSSNSRDYHHSAIGQIWLVLFILKLFFNQVLIEKSILISRSLAVKDTRQMSLSEDVTLQNSLGDGTDVISGERSPSELNEFVF